MGRLLVVLVLLCGTSAQAVTTQITWTNGSADGQFGTASNWNPAQVPDSDDEVFFNGSVSNASCNFPTSVTVGNIHSANGYTGTVTVPVGVTVTAANGTGLSVLAFGTFQINGTLAFVNTATVAFNGGTYVLNGFLDIDADWQAGFVSMSGSGHLKAHKNISFGGGFQSSGTWTLEMYGGAQTIYAASNSQINHLTIMPGSTTKLVDTPQVTHLRVKYDVRIDTNAALDLSGNGVTLAVGALFAPSNATSVIVGATNARILFEGAGNQTCYALGATFPSVETTNGGTVQLMDPMVLTGRLLVGAGTTVTTDDNLTVASLDLGGTLTRGPTSILRFEGTGTASSLGGSPLGPTVFAGSTSLMSDITVGDVTIEGQLDALARTITAVGNNWTVAAGGSFARASGQLVSFAGPVGQQVTIASTNAAFADVDVETTLNVMGNRFSIGGLLHVTSGSVTNLQAPDLSLAAATIEGRVDWTVTGGTLTLGEAGGCF